MSGAEQALATLRDYVQRSTHWEEGGATRHDALKIALPVLEAQRNFGAVHEELLRVAIGHLQAMLKPYATGAERHCATTAALLWLRSIGSEPT